FLLKAPVPPKIYTLSLHDALPIYQYISLCPEISGGLPIPRPPAEIQNGSGLDVLAQKSLVIDILGNDVSQAFIQGAYLALKVARSEEHTSELQSRENLVCRLLLEK